MMALTFSQPWGWALVEGHRLLENRIEPSVAQVAKTLVGRDVAIHVGREWRDYAKAKLQEANIVVPMKVALPVRAVIGVATIAGVCTNGELEQHLQGAELGAARRWAHGPWVILFKDVRPLAKPHPCAARGGSWGGFWQPPAADERKVLELEMRPPLSRVGHRG